MSSLNVNKFCKMVFNEGSISTLIGLPGAGKTNLACTFMDMLTLRGYNIYTNINFFEETSISKAIAMHKLPKIKDLEYIPKNLQIHNVRSLSGLFIGLLSTEKNVTILDEAGIHASSGRATSSRVQAWKELAFIIRHLSSSLLLLAQSKKSVVPDLRETLVEFEMKVRQISPYDRMFTIATAVEKIDDYTNESRIVFEVADGDEYHRIPPTRYPFDSKDFPYFDMDIDLHKVLKSLKEYDSITVREDGNGIRAVQECMQNSQKNSTYLTTGKYAKKYGVSSAAVRNWIAKGMVDYIQTSGGRYRVKDVKPIYKTKNLNSVD